MDKAERDKRLAAALRENLKRRKQARRSAEQPQGDRDDDRHGDDQA